MPCPFCGLVCDDLTVREEHSTLTAIRGACAKARDCYRAAVPTGPNLSDGKAVSLDAAIGAAARVLKHSQQPLFAGLGTDVAGVRATLALAERCGAIVDHMHSRALNQGLRVLQATGWQTTTFSEVRNRADLIVLVGVDLNRNFQNLIPRLLAPAEALHGERRAARQIIYLGPRAAAPVELCGLRCEVIPCSLADLPSALRTVQGVLNSLVGKINRALGTLASALRSAHYPVLMWAPSQLDPSAGDLTIAAACAVIATLNQTQRAAGLALGGDDGGQTALAACAWLTGFPLGISYAGAQLEYAPESLHAARVLEAGGADSLLWISAFSRRAPPPSALPQIVLAPPGLEVRTKNTVYIPVGTPGLDHAGQLMRADAVVSLPLRQLRHSPLPAVASVLTALLSAVG